MALELQQSSKNESGKRGGKLGDVVKLPAVVEVSWLIGAI